MRIVPPLDGVTAVTLVVDVADLNAAGGGAAPGGPARPRIPRPGQGLDADEPLSGAGRDEGGRAGGEVGGEGGLSAWEMLLWGLGPGEAEEAGQLPGLEAAGRGGEE